MMKYFNEWSVWLLLRIWDWKSTLFTIVFTWDLLAIDILRSPNLMLTTCSGWENYRMPELIWFWRAPRSWHRSVHKAGCNLHRMIPKILISWCFNLYARILTNCESTLRVFHVTDTTFLTMFYVFRYYWSPELSTIALSSDCMSVGTTDRGTSGKHIQYSHLNPLFLSQLGGSSVPSQWLNEGKVSPAVCMARSLPVDRAKEMLVTIFYELFQK